MNSCPSLVELQELIGDKLDLTPERQNEICQHVERCTRCQEILDRVSQSDVGRKYALAQSESKSAQLPFLDALASHPPTQLLDADAGSFLAPPERSGEIGRLGSYAILSELGTGGMGVVFLARHVELGRSAAIKISRPSLSLSAGTQRADLVKRFYREAKLASALNHPNIITIYEIGQQDDLVYLAMEYVEGQTLRQLALHQNMQLYPRIEIVRQIASGLAAAHAQGILHRDLKPDNVMLRNDGFIKILDFGLAKARDHSLRDSQGRPLLESSDSLSAAGTLIGTIDFMSPEQVRGEQLTCESDVFSLGVMAYWLFTGEHPFSGESNSEILAAILDRAPRSTRDFSELPNELSRILAGCLAKSVQHRWKAHQVESELQQLIENHQSGQSAIAPAVTLRSKVDSQQDEDTETTTPPQSEIRYARSGDVNIAWQAVGQGPIDIVFVMGWVSHLDWFWKDPSFAAFLTRLSTFARVILFDKRGTGLSDKVPVNELPTLEDRMDDLRAVMDAAQSERAVLLGVSEGGAMSALFAATYPEKSIALVMIGCYARRMWAADYPWGPTIEQREAFLDEIRESWGGPVGIQTRAPSKADDPVFRKWWASYLRMGASPGAAVALTSMNAQIDIRAVLPTIQIPTLVVHRQGDECLRIEEGRYLAESIPGSKMVELPGADHLPFVGDAATLLDHVEEFLTGDRNTHIVDRVLATVLYLVANDTPAMEEFVMQVRRQAELFRGQNLVWRENRAWLSFDGPARAVRAGQALIRVARSMTIQLRCGADTGSCDIVGQEVSGPAAELAATIAEQAPVHAVWVSDSVKNLVSGSGLEFLECSVVDSSDGMSPTKLHQLLD